MNDRRYCQAIKRDGSPCTAWGSKSTGLCPAHSEKSREYQALGGRCRSKAYLLEKNLPTSLKPVLALLLQALTQTHRGELKSSQAQGLASLASAICRTMEVGAFSERIQALEERLENEQLTTK